MASFLAIFPLCAWRHLEIIEADLFERSQQALTDAGIAGVEIDVRGRDLLLTSPASHGGLDEAADLLRRVHGVHRVDFAGPQSSGEAGG